MNPMTTPMQYREANIALSGTGPQTIDLEARSVEAIGASELPVLEMDRRTWEVWPTVILMRGLQLPENGQLPLLDNHSRYEASNVIGSYRDLRIEGDKLIGRAVFSSSPEVEPIWTRVREGHLTDLSIGRMDIVEPIMVPDGQSAVIEGRTFVGPVRVVTQCKPREMSITPIGADEQAKVRSESAPQTPKPQQTENPMAEMNERAEGAPAPAANQPATVQPQAAPVAVATDKDGFARALEIATLCERHAIVGDERSSLMVPELSMDQVRAQVLEIIGRRNAATNPGFAPAARIESGVDEADKFRTAATAGLFLRAGLKLDGERGLGQAMQVCGWNDQALRSAGNELTGYSLRELSRECLRRSGQQQGGDMMAMIGRALTTTDLPNILANVANKSLFEGWAGATETWETWADGSGSVPDFKTNTLAMVGEFDDLDQIVNDSGYQYGEVSDAKETYTLATYGKLAAITRTVIVNDDLGALTDMYMSMGDACSRKVGDAAYGVLTTNGNMRDGVALFHANHGNLGTSGVVSEVTIAEAIKLAGLQKNLKSKQYLNIPLQYFIAPKAIEGAAEIFFNSNQFSSDNKGSTRTNPYGGSKFIRAYDARLDASSSTAFYFAGPKRKTVRLFFLNGNRTPYLEQRTGWSTDGVEYKVRIDVVGKAVDWKALVKNAGA